MATATKKNPAPEPESSSGNTVAVLAPTADNPDAAAAMTAMSYAEQFSVANASDSAKGQEASQRLNAQIKILTDKRMELTRPLDALKKKWMDFFGGPIEKYQAAKKIIDQKVIAWQNEQDRIRREEQERLDREAEKERRRLQDIADEAKRKAEAEAEALRKKAAEAEAAGNAEAAAKLAAKATRVEEKAADKADVFESRAAATVAPTVQAETARVSGSSFVDHYEFEVLDASKLKAEFLTPDLVKIGKIVTSLKMDAVSVVGEGAIKVTSRKILKSRRS